MNLKDIPAVIRRLGLAAILAVSLLLSGCINSAPGVCGIYLEFIYDYNMGYSDAFNPYVECVDVYVFDEEGTYLFAKHSSSDELVDGNRMFLGDDLRYGKYKILTVGGLTKYFTVSANGGAPVAGSTKLEDMRVSLVRESSVVSHEFAPVWVGPAITIDYKADLSVHRISLIKNTNVFNLFLFKTDGDDVTRAETAPCTFEITTPESVSYAYDNSPTAKETVVYTPYSLSPGEDEGEISKGKLNTARLLYGENYEYRLTVRDTGTGKRLWSYDLMKLLEHTKPELRPDGSPLPMQEYLDRQSQWNIVILYKGGTDPEDPEAFIAVAVEINGWIVWLHDIDL